MSSTSRNPKIKKARDRHIPEIAAIADFYAQSRDAHGERIREGFLVSFYSEADYREFLSNCDHFYVALNSSGVIGFLLAFSQELIPESDWVGTQLRRTETQPFTLAKQLAIKADNVNSGVGTSLYRYLLERCSDVPIFSAIVLEPLNQPSVQFHKRLGFEQVREVTPPDGIKRGVWRRMPDREAVS